MQIDETPNEMVYTVKLSSGEELLCILVDLMDTEGGLLVDSPIAVRLIPVMGENGMSNQLASQSWMPFSKKRTFFIPRKDVVAYSQLAEEAVSLYHSTVDRLETQPDKVPELSIESFFVDSDYNLH